jgi:hypothetical protein
MQHTFCFILVVIWETRRKVGSDCMLHISPCKLDWMDGRMACRLLLVVSCWSCTSILIIEAIWPPPKRRAVSVLHRIATQKTVLFIVTAVMNVKSNKCLQFCNFHGMARTNKPNLKKALACLAKITCFFFLRNSKNKIECANISSGMKPESYEDVPLIHHQSTWRKFVSSNPH